MLLHHCVTACGNGEIVYIVDAFYLSIYAYKGGSMYECVYVYNDDMVQCTDRRRSLYGIEIIHIMKPIIMLIP